MLQFINKLYPVSSSAGASGSRHISPVVQEVLSELKSISAAKGEEKSLLLQKNGVHVAFRQCLELEIPSWYRDYQMGPLQLLFVCTHAKACSFIYVLHRRALWVSVSWRDFWILLFCPFQIAALFFSFAPKHCYRIVLFSVSMQTPIHPVYFEILLILEQQSRANK